MATDIIAMSVVIGLSVFIELRRCIYSLGIIRSVDCTPNTMAAIIIVGITMIAGRVMMLVPTICNHSLNDRAEHSTRYDTAYIMTVMIILARTWIKPIATTVVITANICKYTGATLSNPYVAALRIISPRAI